LPLRQTPKGNICIHLDERNLDRLRKLRGSGESYSDVIIRRAGIQRQRD
jgi:hypothetical protein